jgi:hypothetical protein
MNKLCVWFKELGVLPKLLLGLFLGISIFAVTSKSDPEKKGSLDSQTVALVVPTIIPTQQATPILTPSPIIEPTNTLVPTKYIQPTQAKVLGIISTPIPVKATSKPTPLPTKAPLQVQIITSTPKPATNACGYSCSGPDLDCKDFSTHSQAQSFFDCCGFSAFNDPMRLDKSNGVGNGIACESLP